MFGAVFLSPPSERNERGDVFIQCVSVYVCAADRSIRPV